MNCSQSILRLHPNDNVAVALAPLHAGADLGGYAVGSDVPAGHKVACNAVETGAPVVKFGQLIGRATQRIHPGEHVHAHNLSFETGDIFAPVDDRKALALPEPTRTVFRGYVRPDGRVGTRNFVGILASVNCSASVCHAIAARANAELLPGLQNIDGFVPLVHDHGCGMQSSGEGFEALLRVLKGYRDHPNFGGVLIVGLGCEVNQVTLYKPTNWRDARISTLNIQETSGSASAVAVALGKLSLISKAANEDMRTECPVSKLTLGMQCGGSDALSGITANPALGVASDILVGNGGTSILSETPEIFGAQHLLIHRSNAMTGRKIEGFLHWWKNYAAKNGATLDNNPSPGNKRGGLTTILEKSLGAVAKAGQSPLTNAYAYAERIDTSGLVYMDSPGYDPVAATGQVAAGANLIAFTTGRGSCFGAKPAPSLKIASNGGLAQSMPEEIDVDAGPIATGAVSIASKGLEIFERLIDLANGEKSKSEMFGYGDLEFVPWKIGATL